LTGLSAMARSLSAKLHELSLPEAIRADELVEGIQQTHDDVQRAIKGMGPVEVDPLGLMVALEELVDATGNQLDVDIRFLCEEEVAVENHSSATHLYHIAQEAVTNALKHSKAEHITVSLSKNDDRLLLEIRDDGVGIGEDAKEPRGMGLRIMRYRAMTLGANLRMDSPSGGGTRIACACA
ncbi:MAG: ATP-binding protein, partial [Candidatus Hydrogenedentes bacterium]|nr:ATP-binding protein [Candidatus Hydrogenedentota bacterium]